MNKLFSIACAIYLSLCPAYAEPSEELDPASSEALRKTQELLTNPTQRGQAISQDQKAKAANSQLQAVAVSTQNTQAGYELASDIFADITKQAQGDPQKILEIINQAEKNPAAFGNRLSPAQLAKIKEIASQPGSRK